MKIVSRLALIALLPLLSVTLGFAATDAVSNPDLLKKMQKQEERNSQLEQSWLSSIEIHGFISQGFMYSTENNYLTLQSEDGSAEWHDAGINFSKRLTDNLRVGVQFYTYNIGDLGNYNLELDWAFGDYQWRDWLGVRLGKIKTPIGLYNDAQDLEFLHTWILLPQSIYPVGPRSQFLAHNGIDFYGSFDLDWLGYLSYQTYYGSRELDKNGGFYKNYEYSKKGLNDLSVDWLAGIHLEWETPLEGLLLGYSFMADKYTFEGTTAKNFGPVPVGTEWQLKTDGYKKTSQVFVEYERDRLRLQAEYRRTLTKYQDDAYSFLIKKGPKQDTRGWYVAMMYRFTNWLEAGTYYSKFIKYDSEDHDDPDNSMEDICLTLRFDINQYWTVKVEGHLVDGVARGLFAGANPDGKEDDWKFIAIKTSFNF